MQRDSRLVRGILVVFFVALLAYGAYEAQGFLMGPAINLPSERLTVSDAHIVIEGSVARIVELRMNGQVIPVTENDTFSEPHLLSPGLNYIVFEARDARGRTTERHLEIVYQAR